LMMLPTEDMDDENSMSIYEREREWWERKKVELTWESLAASDISELLNEYHAFES
jgi:hypothetical protein